MDDTEALAKCKDMAEEVKNIPDYKSQCLDGELVFFVEHTHALMPGHIYSYDGVREFKISKCCEFHFDEWLKDPKDE